MEADRRVGSGVATTCQEKELRSAVGDEAEERGEDADEDGDETVAAGWMTPVAQLRDRPATLASVKVGGREAEGRGRSWVSQEVEAARVASRTWSSCCVRLRLVGRLPSSELGGLAECRSEVRPRLTVQTLGRASR